MSGSDPSVGRTRRGSGQGGGGAGGGSGSGSGRDEQCPGDPFNATLGSPIPDAVASLSEGDLLDIEAVETPIRGVIAQTLDGTLVGALTRDILHLRNCIAADYEYEAEVLRLAGGSVTIVVRERS